jgi:GNAT superfamily N-acetyltransferase
MIDLPEVEIPPIHIRQAVPTDVPLILEFIRQKADFDVTVHAFDGELGTNEAAIRKTLFGPLPFAHVLFAESSEEALGFALYYYRYSSFRGRPSMWLDDLYVLEKSRGKRVGFKLMYRLAEICLENRCNLLAWTASVFNTHGLDFYRRLGAVVVDQKESTLYFEWSEEAYCKLVGAAPNG